MEEHFRVVSGSDPLSIYLGFDFWLTCMEMYHLGEITFKCTTNSQMDQSLQLCDEPKKKKKEEHSLVRIHFSFGDNTSQLTLSEVILNDAVLLTWYILRVDNGIKSIYIEESPKIILNNYIYYIFCNYIFINYQSFLYDINDQINLLLFYKKKDIG